MRHVACFGARRRLEPLLPLLANVFVLMSCAQGRRDSWPGLCCEWHWAKRREGLRSEWLRPLARGRQLPFLAGRGRTRAGGARLHGVFGPLAVRRRCGPVDGVRPVARVERLAPGLASAAAPRVAYRPLRQVRHNTTRAVNKVIVTPSLSHPASQCLGAWRGAVDPQTRLFDGVIRKLPLLYALSIGQSTYGTLTQACRVKRSHAPWSIIYTQSSRHQPSRRLYWGLCMPISALALVQVSSDHQVLSSL